MTPPVLTELRIAPLHYPMCVLAIGTMRQHTRTSDHAARRRAGTMPGWCSGSPEVTSSPFERRRLLCYL